MNNTDFRKMKSEEIEKIIYNFEEANLKAENIFKDSSNKYIVLLTPLYQRLSSKDIKDIITLQSESLSIRAQIQSDIFKYMNHLSKAYNDIRKAEGERTEYYLTNFGVKTSNGDKTSLINRDLRAHKNRCELIEAYLEFLRDCKYNIDQIQFSIKN